VAINDGQFFTWAQLEALLGEAQALRAFDDDNAGQVDDAAVNRIIEDADMAVIGAAVKSYPDQVASTVTAATAHSQLRSIALQYAKALAQSRHPGVWPVDDVDKAMDRAEKRVTDLAMGRTHLRGVEQSNARAVTSNGVTLGGSTKRTFDNFGDF